jgi:hypothetical protein
MRDGVGDKFKALHRALEAAGEADDERLANDSCQAARQDGVGKRSKLFARITSPKSGNSFVAISRTASGATSRRAIPVMMPTIIMKSNAG